MRNALLQFAWLLTSAWGALFVGYSRLRIETQSSDRLVLISNGWRFVADGKSRLISSRGRPIANFDVIDTVDITQASNQKAAEGWGVALRLSNSTTVRLGWSGNDLDASEVAAALGTITGKRVRLLQTMRWL